MYKQSITLKCILITIFLIACLFIPTMATTASLGYPMILSGDIIINGVDAPAGTIIEAKEGDKLQGTTTVQVDGKYGNTALNKLPVTKPDGVSVDLYIQLPTMSASVKVASVIWESNDKTFNIDANIGASIGSDDSIGGGTSTGALTGDVNGDGILSSVDALMALQMSAGNIAEDLAADVSGDGSVTSLDALMILQASVGAIVL